MYTVATTGIQHSRRSTAKFDDMLFILMLNLLPKLLYTVTGL